MSLPKSPIYKLRDTRSMAYITCSASWKIAEEGVSLRGYLRAQLRFPGEFGDRGVKNEVATDSPGTFCLQSHLVDVTGQEDSRNALRGERTTIWGGKGVWQGTAGPSMYCW